MTSAASNDAERALIGTLIIEPQHSVETDLTSADFGDPIHAKLFDAIRDAAAATRPIDAVILAHQFRADRDFEDAGGATAILADLVTDCVAAEALPVYAELIRDGALMRRREAVLQRAGRCASEGREADFLACLDELERSATKTHSIRTGWTLHAPNEGVTNSLAINWAVKRLIGRGDLALIYGPSGSGKSFFALDLAHSIAAGHDWRDLPVTQGSVLYVAAEGDRGVLLRRRALQVHTDSNDAPLFILDASPSLLEAGDISGLVSVSRQCQNRSGSDCVLIVVDTLARVTPGANENSFEDMGRAIQGLNRLQRETGAAVLAVHHTGKDVARGPRGHSSLRAAVDTAIEIERGEGGQPNRARVVKQKDGEDGEAFGFSLRSVEVGRDADGDVVRSCVVEHVEAVTAKATGPKLPAGCKIALRALHNAIVEFGEPGPTSPHIPASVRVVAVTEWRKQALREGISNGDTQDAAYRAFARAKERLNADGIVGIFNELAWIRSDAD